jgi:hypothetical protein
MKDNKNVQQINIELSQEVSEGEYSNFVVVTHSPAEFVMDFTKILPGVRKARVHSRVIMAPQHAKAFLAALGDKTEKYRFLIKMDLVITQLILLKDHCQINKGTNRSLFLTLSF